MQPWMGRDIGDNRAMSRAHPVYFRSAAKRSDA